MTERALRCPNIEVRFLKKCSYSLVSQISFEVKKFLNKDVGGKLNIAIRIASRNMPSIMTPEIWSDASQHKKLKNSKIKDYWSISCEHPHQCTFQHLFFLEASIFRFHQIGVELCCKALILDHKHIPIKPCTSFGAKKSLTWNRRKLDIFSRSWGQKTKVSVMKFTKFPMR